MENELPSGAQLDFLIGAANETKEQMTACAKALGEYKTVILYDPNDAKAIKQLYKEYGIEVDANVVTYTSFVAGLIKNGKLEAKNTGKSVVFQDPYQLSRDLEETEVAREIVMSYAVLGEMLLNKAETVWAGNILMAQYIPDVMKLIAGRRIFNAKSLNESVIVTASVSEYASLKAAADENIEILSIEDLILG
jgi:Fe-S oxidoreductase